MIEKDSFEEYFNVIRWTMSVGVNPGYDLKQQKPMDIERISALYQETALEVLEDTGTYVSAVCHESRVLYNMEWGCPKGGEYAYTFSGSFNPAFSEKTAYLEALRMVAQRMRRKLEQATLLLEIVPAHVEYLRD